MLVGGLETAAESVASRGASPSPSLALLSDCQRTDKDTIPIGGHLARKTLNYFRGNQLPSTYALGVKDSHPCLGAIFGLSKREKSHPLPTAGETAPFRGLPLMTPQQMGFKPSPRRCRTCRSSRDDGPSSGQRREPSTPAQDDRRGFPCHRKRCGIGLSRNRCSNRRASAGR